MLKPNKRWHILEANAKEIDQIVNTSKVHPVIAKLLALRGIKEDAEINRFLNNDISSLHNPFLLDGMQKAVDRINLAILKNEKILIYGDYDADGITSTTILYKTLRRLDANFAYYIPNRFTEGYGLNKNAIEKAAKEGFSVIITVDTGISAVEEAKVAKELGISLIITDHHEPSPILPDAFALINPKIPGDSYPFKYLAGVGVAFKLAQGLLGKIPVELLDIAAIGTIADLVPLVDENRIIASLGLKQMENTQHVGLRILLENNGLIDKPLTAGHIGFVIAPRINASGRLASAAHAVKLLITNSVEEANEISDLISEINQERQTLVESITKEAFEIIDSQDMENDKVLVIAKEDWNVGVIGIVAARILEKYYRPTIILSIDPETKMVKGSARSIERYDIFQALTNVKEILLHFGGHPAAAGLTINQSDILELRMRLNQLANDWLNEEDFIPIEKIDTVCTLEDIDIQLIKQIEKLAPFGMGNPSPRFLIDQLEVTALNTLGKTKRHLKLNVEDKNKSMEAILFKMGDLFKDIAPYSKVQLLGELSINEWKGNVKPQIIVKDLQISTLQIFDWRKNVDWIDHLDNLSHDNTAILYDENKSIKNNREDIQVNPYNKLSQQEISNLRALILLHLPPSIEALKEIIQASKKLERIYCIFEHDNNIGSSINLDRDLFKKVYLFVKQSGTVQSIIKTKHNFKNLKINSETIQFILDVFAELGFIIIDGDQIKLNPNPEKKEIKHSILYQRFTKQEELKELFIHSNHNELKEWILTNYIDE